MEVLDTSIANVALPHMAGTLGASQEEATWVLTSYLVSSAIVLPISGWLSTRFGRKRFYMTCVALFTVCSLLCGLAPTLPLLILARILQGLGGGGLAPSEQAILADTFPVEQSGQAFALYGMAVVAAPAIGPTLGGWITDNFNWHWIFFINLPIGIISLLLSNRMVEDPPYLVKERARARPIDRMGLGLVAVGVGCLEFVLDKGQEKDWFGDRDDYPDVYAGHGHAGNLRVVGVETPGPDCRLEAAEEPQLWHRRRLPIHPRLGAFQHHRPDSPISPGTDGVHRRARRHGALRRGSGVDGDDAGGRESWCRSWTPGSWFPLDFWRPRWASIT